MSQSADFLNGVLGLVITSALLISIPGPSIMFLVGQTLSVGRKKALQGVIGNAIGMYSVAIIFSFGLGALILGSQDLMVVVRILGAIVLLGIGLQYIFSEPAITKIRDTSGFGKRSKSLTAGIIVGFTNPKAFIMFGTIVPSYLSKGSANSIMTLLGYSLIPIGLGILIDAAWVLAADSLSSQAMLNKDRIRVVNVCGGFLIIAMAILLSLAAIQGGSGN